MVCRFVAIGNDNLQSAMQNVSNWMTASESGLNQLVQLSMTILMQILRLRPANQHTKDNYLHTAVPVLSPLESIIYTQPKQRDNFRIIPVVTSYMSNIFNRRLPLLSCLLLRRFAIEFQMSLLACLDMEPDQIRLTFLQRLPDDLESDQLKIAVIEFVEACIKKQPGLTEAFFKIKNEKRYLEKGPKTKDIGDGILTYMTQYLDTISKDSSRIVSPLLSKIMSLFHALWKNNMQSLVHQLIQTNHFWSSLFNPLYGPIKNDIQAYSQLFNILGIELFRCTSGKDMDPNLKKAFDHFFDPDIFEKWVTNILTLPRETIDELVPDETPEWLCRLQSFKDFFVLLVRRSQLHDIVVPSKSRKFFADKCLATLVERSVYMDDYRPFIILSELYLVLLLSFDTKYTDSHQEDDTMVAQITMLLNQTAISYREIHGRARESILAISLRSMDLLATEMIRNPSVRSDFMRSIVEILCYEIADIEIIVNNKTSNADNAHSLSFMLCLNLLKKISLNCSNVDVSSSWCNEIISNRIVNRLLSCLNATLQEYQFRKTVVDILDVIIVLAQGVCSSELLHCDIGNYLWLKLLPPKELLQCFSVVERQSGVVVPSLSKWQTNDWWPIYARGIQMVTVLLQQHGHLFLREALMFVGVHEEYVIDSILLAKQSMNTEAVALIKTSLLFVCELIQFDKQWRLEHSQSMINLMVSREFFEIEREVTTLWKYIFKSFKNNK